MDKLTQSTQQYGLTTFSGPGDPKLVAGPRQTIAVQNYTLAAESVHILPPAAHGYLIEDFRAVTVSGSNDGTMQLQHTESADISDGTDQDVCAAVTISNSANDVTVGAIDASTTYETDGGNDVPVNKVEKGRWLHVTSTAGTSKVVNYFITYRELEVN